MRYSKIISIVLLLAFICGCSWVKHQQPSTLPSDPIPFVKTGKILNSKRLKQGGKLLIIPFKAGEDVEATDEIDKLALTIVKGIAEKLQVPGSPFKVIFAENANEADLSIEGHIIGVGRSSTFEKLILMDKGKSLSVSGKLVDQKTGETILVFTDVKQDQDKSKTFIDLAYGIGRDVGDYVLAMSQKK